MKTTICNLSYLIYLIFTTLLSSCQRNREEPVPADLGPGFTVNDFSKSSAISVQTNAQVKGTAMAMFYTRESPEAEIGNKEHFDVSKGFISTFTFAGKSGNYLQIRLHAMDGSIYNPYGISAILDKNAFNIGHSITNTLVQKSMPALFDGKKHTIKIQVQNLSDQGLLTKIFIDNMNEAAFIGDDSTSFDRKELYIAGPKAKRRVSLMFFGNDLNQGEISLYNWAFKPM